MPLALVITGIRFGIGLKFFYLLHPIRLIKDILSGKGGYKSLSLALAGTLGVGNIVGVASAIAMGGAGSVFWMVLSAFVAMGIKYVETYLAVKHKRWDGEAYTGGAPLYIEKAIKGKNGHVVALIFAFMCVSNSLITGNLVQINAVSDILPINKLDGGTVLYYLLAQKYDLQFCSKILKITSITFISIIFVWGLYVFVVSRYNISLIIIAIFLIISLFSDNEY
jgi:AGCS family alanine or glycine:cation symporter